MTRMFAKSCIALLAALLLAWLPSRAQALDPNHSGSWYDPAASGHGFSLEIYADNSALLFWYTYDNAGQAVWLYGEGTVSGNTITFGGYYSEGMRFGVFNPAQNTQRLWGSMTMVLQDCDTATLQYQSTLTGFPHAPVGAGTINLKRLVGIKGNPCRPAGTGYWSGRHFDPTLNNGAGAWADLSGVLTGDGRVFFNSIASDEVMLGTYTSTGDTLNFQIRTCEDGGAACFNSTGTAAHVRRDSIVGSATSAPYGTQPLQLSYRTVFERDASLAALAGAYTLQEEGVNYTVTVTAAGAVSGSDSQGCTYQGQLGVLDAESNVYSYQGTLAGCANQIWSGVVVNTDAVIGDKRVLEFRIDTGTGGVAFALTR